MNLTAYLNDHLTDETLGIALARRAGADHEGTRLGTFLEMLSWELEEDRDTLVKLMAELGVGRHLTAIRATMAEKMRKKRMPPIWFVTNVVDWPATTTPPSVPLDHRRATANATIRLLAVPGSQVGDGLGLVDGEDLRA